jgi:Lon protease-like protein
LAKTPSSSSKSSEKKKGTPAAPVTTFVFPLDEMVFFPTCAVPINVHEPRYLMMVRDAIASKTPIALTAVDPSTPGRKPVVAGSGTPQILETRPDGTLLVLVVGTTKVRLKSVLQDAPYISCEAVPVSENLEVLPANAFKLNRLKQRLTAWIAQNLESASIERAEKQLLETPQRIVETLAQYTVQDADIRQAILELDDINERIDWLVRLSGGNEVKGDRTLH